MYKLSLALLLSLASLIPAHAADTIKLPPDFEYEEIYTGVGMTAMDFDAAGRMYVCQKMGRVLMFTPKGKNFNDPVVLVDFTTKVNSENESGLLGIAVDPKFATNHFIYVFYTTNTDQRLVRYTVNADSSAVTDELVLLTGLPKDKTEHKSGDIHFSPKDDHSIFITVGDDTNQKATNDLTAFNGKVLRVNSADGKGFADNPFTDGNLDSVASRVWAYGFRNPFRFIFPPDGVPADTIYISESGDTVDRIASVTKGAKGGWGDSRDDGIRTPADPKIHNMLTHKPSLTGLAMAKTGPFAAPDGVAIYWEHWYGPDLHRGKLSGENLDQYAQIATDATDTFAAKCKCVNLIFGPDGSLYTTQTWFGPSPNRDSRLGRIKYTGAPKPAAPAATGTTPAAPVVAPAAQ